MKYILEIILVVALLWIGRLWNGEKQNGLGLADENDKLKAAVARLELDLGQAKDAAARAGADLQATKALLDQASKDLLEKTDALSAKTVEADELREAGLKLKARVAELEGYKAQAIVAEMPKPLAPDAP
jgi:hypothetical protein